MTRFLMTRLLLAISPLHQLPTARGKSYTRYTRPTGLLLFSLVAMSTACGKPPVSSTDSPSPIASASQKNSSPAAASSSPVASPTPEAAGSTVISAQGIGAAQLGITLGELKETLGEDTEFTVEAPFIVDFDAIAVRQNEEVQYYILYLAGENFGDEDVIQGLLTDNPKFRTREGIGAGTNLSEAEQIYGKATLSYNTQNESREYARFEQQPASNVSFATGSGGSNLAGVYASSSGEYNETQEFREGASIESVLVICLSEACAPQPAN